MQGLTWVGLAGMSDPIRPGMAELMQRLRRAGVRPIVMTGDQKSYLTIGDTLDGSSIARITIAGVFLHDGRFMPKISTEGMGSTGAAATSTQGAVVATPIIPATPSPTPLPSPTPVTRPTSTPPNTEEGPP